MDGCKKVKPAEAESKPLSQAFNFKIELLAIFLLLSFLLLPFYKTVFEGAPISKAVLLDEMDAVQRPELAAPWCIRDDLSTSMAHVPNEFFVQSLDKSGILPLWNNLNGAGRPFLAEFQTLQFSLFHYFFPFSLQYLYNLGLFFKLLLSATGAYLLFRSLHISRPASIAAAISYAFIPHCLRFTELVDNFCFYPWLAALFLHFAKKPALKGAVICAVATAFLAYNMHPETFACAAGLAALLSLFYRHQSIESTTESTTQPSASFKSKLLWLFFVAVLSFTLAAPLILPLLEFIKNGASYKFASHQIEHINFSDFIFDLFLPASTGSSYCGLILALCLPLGMYCFFQRQKAVLGAFLAVLLFSTRPGVLESFLSQAPFSLLLPEYTLYAALLLMLLISASGLDEFFGNRISNNVKLHTALGSFIPAILILFANLPIIAPKLPRLGELYFSAQELVPAYFLQASILLALGFFLLQIISLISQSRISSERIQISPRWQSSAMFFFSIANTLLLIWILPQEMGTREAFTYKHNSVSEKLRSLDGRLIATGYNLFQPNCNLVYGLDDFRSTAPLYPERYTKFLKLGGGGGKFCTIPSTPETLNHIYDLASIKYILSDKVLESVTAESKSENFENFKNLRSAVDTRQLNKAEKLADGLRLNSATASYEKARGKLRARAIFTLHGPARGHYAAALSVINEQGKEINKIRWLNDRIEEAGEDCGNHRYAMNFSMPLPENSTVLKSGSTFVARIVVRDNWTAKTLEKNLEIGSFEFAKPEDKDGRFRRLADLEGGLYLYENTGALPRTYLVHDPVFADSANDSLKMVESQRNQFDSKIDWRNCAVIESRKAEADWRSAPASLRSSVIEKEEARILDADPESILIFANCSKDGFLILTDTYYPGWKAYIDGSESEIYPANHMFRAVKLKAGKHRILFKYEPASFKIGCILFAGGCLLIVAVFFLQMSKRLNGLLAKKQATEKGAEKKAADLIASQ